MYNLSLLCHPEPSKSTNSCCFFFYFSLIMSVFYPEYIRWWWPWNRSFLWFCYICCLFLRAYVSVKSLLILKILCSNTLISGECIQVVNDVFPAFDSFRQKFVLILADEIYVKPEMRYGGYHVIVFVQTTGLLHQHKHTLLLWARFPSIEVRHAPA